MPDLTYQDVLKILRLIDSAPSFDLELEFDGTHLKVKRRAVTRAAAAPEPEVEEKPSQRAPAGFPDGIEVKPPMAGTFYCAPSPGAAPFVDVDGAVQKGDQLGIVEVMKLFTPVLAPCGGTVRAILVKNEEFVESDRTLMLIEAARRG